MLKRKVAVRGEDGAKPREQRRKRAIDRDQPRAVRRVQLAEERLERIRRRGRARVQKVADDPPRRRGLDAHAADLQRFPEHLLLRLCKGQPVSSH